MADFFDTPAHPTASPKEIFAGEFSALRRYLYTVAYNILGMRSEAEDVVQDVFTRIWDMNELPVFDSIKSYCTKAVINHAVTRKKHIQRETAVSYWGVWLPEPEVQIMPEIPHSEDFDRFDMPQALGIGLLRLMESLSPAERAVYVMGELFEERYTDIAIMLDITESNARKLMQRAKEKLEAGKKRFSASPERHAALFGAFAAATGEGRYEALFDLLKEDAVMYSDGGGKVVAARIPVYGREKIIAGLRNIALWSAKNEPSVTLPCIVNGRLGAILFHAETKMPLAALTMEADDDGISELYAVRNPDKIRHLQSAKF